MPPTAATTTEAITEHPTYVVSQAFVDGASAERALHRLAALGLGPDDVSVVMRGELRVEASRAQPSRAAGGAAAGGTIGAVLAGMTTFAFAPPVAIVGIAGPLLASLGGAVLGGTAGTLTGALVGAQFPREHAERVERHVEAGDVVLTVTAPDREAAARIGAACAAAGGTRVGFDHPVPEPTPP